MTSSYIPLRLAGRQTRFLQKCANIGICSSIGHSPTYLCTKKGNVRAVWFMRDTVEIWICSFFNTETKIQANICCSCTPLSQICDITTYNMSHTKPTGCVLFLPEGVGEGHDGVADELELRLELRVGGGEALAARAAPRVVAVVRRRQRPRVAALEVVLPELCVEHKTWGYIIRAVGKAKILPPRLVQLVMVC